MHGVQRASDALLHSWYGRQDACLTKWKGEGESEGEVEVVERRGVATDASKGGTKRLNSRCTGHATALVSQDQGGGLSHRPRDSRGPGRGAAREAIIRPIRLHSPARESMQLSSARSRKEKVRSDFVSKAPPPSPHALRTVQCRKQAAADAAVAAAAAAAAQWLYVEQNAASGTAKTTSNCQQLSWPIPMPRSPRRCLDCVEENVADTASHGPLLDRSALDAARQQSVLDANGVAAVHPDSGYQVITGEWRRRRRSGDKLRALDGTPPSGLTIVSLLELNPRHRLIPPRLPCQHEATLLPCFAFFIAIPTPWPRFPAFSGYCNTTNDHSIRTTRFRPHHQLKVTSDDAAKIFWTPSIPSTTKLPRAWEKKKTCRHGAVPTPGQDQICASSNMLDPSSVSSASSLLSTREA
ncbi:uncharacterized protein MYCFIDRAFT_176949 [Pseudocercospora fijiensis CIRAD86]|uniref:Uncharacterized protein n=1 Tax=Pseudocercospora fijiensis (strain CIRAD86) TaxID=383855 RepID=M2YQE7_PSEFD|nr:uncharacterized protein MYCFIDRAFT_176949 [Pseudocercospora fijiensis CIRAD86]EME79950.1 hypothetical protein MYCFIDRAFT_176949 [Pseudocercospora fijiensis CIRAD86]